MDEHSTSYIMSSMTDAVLRTLEGQCARLKAAHPGDPAAVVAGIETWITEQKAQNDARWNAPVMGNFHRVFGPDGTIIRDWWPDPAEATLKRWLSRNAPPGSTLERKRDIAREGDRSWFRGKSAGEALDRD